MVCLQGNYKIKQFQEHRRRDSFIIILLHITLIELIMSYCAILILLILSISRFVTSCGSNILLLYLFITFFLWGVDTV